MSVWKSPVFYFGVLLVLAVAAALLAPFVYDWNSYRPQLEAYGHKLTGRDVKVAGGISVRLFPWPRLTLDDVHIANPPGMASPDFASAERITVALQLAGLFNGNFQVESIDVDKPVIALERQAAGQGNWLLEPAPEIRRNDLAERVKLDHITLNDAIVHVKDDRRGTGDMQFDVPRVMVTAPGFTGPWRAQADAVKFRGQRFAASLTTAELAAGQPVRFGFTVKPAGDAAAASYGYGLAFDGVSDAGKLSGEVRLEPAAETSGKGDSEGKLRRLLVTAKADGDFDRIALSNIQVAPIDPKEGGALINGTATIALGRQVDAHVSLSANKLDLSAIAGAQVNTALRQGGILAAADALLAMLPENVSLGGDISATALQSGGETLENIVLKLDAAREAIRVQELSASLPGRSRALFKGVFFPGKAGAELAGSLALETSDLRAFSTWLWPNVKPKADALWKGSRGHFKLQTDMNLTEADLRFSKARYELDSVPGSFELKVASGGRGSVDLRLDAEKLDVDDIAGGSLGVQAQGGKRILTGLLPALVPDAGAPDVRLVVQAGEVLLNGVSAKDVTIDTAAGSNGLDLRTLELGSVGGARLSASGLVLDSGRGPDGSVGVDIAADDPRGLLRLLGLAGAGGDPAWFSPLGKSALKGTLTVKAGEQGPQIGFDASGTSGNFSVTASGNADAQGHNLSGTLELKSPSSAELIRLAGLTAAANDQAPARVNITAAPVAGGGFQTDIQAQGFGVQASFNGTLGGAERLASGKLSLRSTDISTLAAAIGLPAAELPASRLILDADVTGDSDSVKLAALQGRVGDAPVAGDIAVTTSRRVTGKLSMGELYLRQILPPVFLGWYGAAPGPESNFAARPPFGITGEFWLTPKTLTIANTFRARDVQVGLTAYGQEIRMALFGKDETGKDASVEIGSKGTDANRTIDAKISLPVDLAQQLRLAGGAPVAEGAGRLDLHLNTTGRSPGGALAGLSGTGTFKFDKLRFTSISPAGFTQALANAKDAAGLTAAFDALRGPGGLDFGTVSGIVNIDHGIASFMPVKLSTPDADATLKTTADLNAGAVDIGVTLNLKAQAGLPPAEVAFVGPPGALARTEDKQELAAKLGISLMQQGVVELERLQQEQQRLAAQEEEQRKQDEAKLAAYYAQRDELLLRKREMRVFSDVRLAAAEKLRQEIDAQRSNNAEINKNELLQRRREIRVYRRLANLDAGPPFAIEVVQKPRPAPAPPPAPRPRPAAPKTAAPALPPQQVDTTPPAGPLILVPPGQENPSPPSQ